MNRHADSLKSLRVGVLRFPGSNCDFDTVDALKRHFMIDAEIVWYGSKSLPKLDALVIPGGFSFGDYLRSGALASHSPIMQDIQEFAARGGHIMGICNGFQILVESKLLPGILLHNESMKFICKPVYIRSDSGQVLKMPIAHGEGRYYADPKTLKEITTSGRIAYRYCDQVGEVTQSSNPNGSLMAIAGVYSANKHILGMMPHPERATDAACGGSIDGLIVWSDFLRSL
jgi:phosphoribosylformylglycinamidine synthase I